MKTKMILNPVAIVMGAFLMLMATFGDFTISDELKTLYTGIIHIGGLILLITGFRIEITDGGGS